jgi:hypothetical protein
MEELKYKVGIETDRIEPSDLIDPGVINTLVELNNELEDYKEKLKALSDLEKKQGELTQEQSRLQQQYKLDLKNTQNQIREIRNEIAKVDTAVRTGANSYKGLVEENKALMDAMRNIPFDDTTGELEKLQAQYNANNEALKKFDEELGNHQRNVGNYRSGLGEVSGTLANLPGGIGKAVTSFRTFNAVLKANPIGLIVTAVAGLIAILSKLEPVQKLINHLTMVFGETITFATNALSTFIDGQERNIGTLKDQIALNKQLKVAEEAVANARAQTPEALANIENEIAKIDLALSKSNLTEQQRNDLLSQRAKLGNDLVETKRNELLAEQNLLATELLKNKTEQEKQEIRNKSSQIQAELVKLSTEGIVKETDANNKLNDDRLKAQEEQKKREEDAARLREKKLEEERKAIESLAAARQGVDIKMFDSLDKMREGEIDLAIDLIPTLDMTSSTLAAELFGETLKQQTIERLEEEGKLVEAAEQQKLFRIQELTQMFIDAGVNANQAALDAQEQANLEYAGKIKEAKEGELVLSKQVEEGKRQAAISTANSIVSLGESLFGKTKALAVAQAIIDTFASANSAAKNTPGGVLAKSLAAAAMIAKGIVNVKKILSTKPGGGSISGGGGTSAGAVATLPSVSAQTLVNPERLSGQSPFATGMASSAGNQAMNRGEINIQANVDRRGLAIAVREGERSIRTQQFDYR